MLQLGRVFERSLVDSNCCGAASTSYSIGAGNDGSNRSRRSGRNQNTYAYETGAGAQSHDPKRRIMTSCCTNINQH